MKLIELKPHYKRYADISKPFDIIIRTVENATKYSFLDNETFLFYGTVIDTTTGDTIVYDLKNNNGTYSSVPIDEFNKAVYDLNYNNSLEKLL